MIQGDGLGVGSPGNCAVTDSRRVTEQLGLIEDVANEPESVLAEHDDGKLGARDLLPVDEQTGALKKVGAAPGGNAPATNGYARHPEPAR